MLTLQDAMDDLPLVAIIRGVTPGEVAAVAQALHGAGVRIVEVPLNSPHALESIGLLARAFPGRLVCGGGTMLTPNDADAVADAGGQIAVSPNTDGAVIRRSIERGMTPMPGFATASEAFHALQAGAMFLKLFPAGVYGPGLLRQLKAVLPAEAVVAPVGGVGPGQIADWWAAGARAFGVGSEIYRPGDTPEAVAAKAQVMVQAVRAARG